MDEVADKGDDHITKIQSVRQRSHISEGGPGGLQSHQVWQCDAEHKAWPDTGLGYVSVNEHCSSCRSLVWSSV